MPSDNSSFGSRENPPASKAKKPRKSLWDLLIFGTPFLDQLQQAWAWAGQANRAAVVAPQVGELPEVLRSSPAARTLNRVHLLGAIETVIGSKAFQFVARFLSRPGVLRVGQIAGRIAPFIGAGFAFFDVRSAIRTHHNPQATSHRKALATIKAAVSTIGAGAGFAALILAPTGAGAIVAGGIALGAGLLAMGLDLAARHLVPN